MNQRELKEILEYEPITGLFIWKKNIKRSKTTKKGSLAGSKDSNGYINIKIKGKVHKAHRLAWLYVTGEHPDKDIDHINHISGDNRFSNLRLVTKSENQKNRRLNKNNKSGCVGVSQKKSGQWQAHAQSNGKNKLLGTFDTKEEAITARIKANKKYDFHKNHGT